jgi:beta-glucuronidase
MKKLYLLLGLSIALFLWGNDSNLLINVDNRETISLNGNWRFIIDPFENGYYDYRLLPLEDGYFKNAKQRDRTERIEYNFDESGTLVVPGDWNTQDDRLFFYEGTIWYKKSFDYDRERNKRVFIYFGAVNYHAIVYLNGEKIGEHTGGFTPFNFEITDKLKERGNYLIVKVDNKRHLDGVPTVNFDWWNYGGLTRRVMLIEVPETFIQDYLIQLKKGKEDEVEGWVRLNGVDMQQKITIKIPELEFEKDFNTNKYGLAGISFKGDFKLWSPHNPKLYKVIISSETDEIEDKIGFRWIEVMGEDILLNGEPVFLHGICIHEDAPLRTGRAFSIEDAKILLGWVKELNCNFVRLAHYPHNENMMRMADSMGIMVWAEIPVYWTIQWENNETFMNARNQLSEIITRDKNRASVIMWSMGNETPLYNSRLNFMSNLAKFAREKDQTRLITAAIESHYKNENTVIIDDPLGKYLDVLGCNEYIGWYDGLPEKCNRIVWETIYDKPLIISECGGGALYGFHGDELTRWSEEYQESIYKHQISMLKRIQFLKGMTPWILKDFRSPRRPLPVIQDFFNRKGLISNNGQKKKAFYVLREFYREIEKKFE